MTASSPYSHSAFQTAASTVTSVACRDRPDMGRRYAVNQQWVVPKRQTESWRRPAPLLRSWRGSAAGGAGSRHAQNALILAHYGVL
jgi:hypothetical protein